VQPCGAKDRGLQKVAESGRVPGGGEHRWAETHRRPRTFQPITAFLS